ncbi:MAG: transposase [Nostochopsis sp.]
MRKLTESDKQEILQLYRQTAETTSTLAERYDVSNSTISRLLKSTLPEDEYEYLVSLKRAARTPEGKAQVSYDQLPSFVQIEPEASEEPQEKVSPPQEVQPNSVVETDSTDSTSNSRRVKRRSSAPHETKRPVIKQLELLESKAQEINNISSPLIEDVHTDSQAIAQILGEELLDESEDLEDLDDDLEEEDFDDDEDFEEEEEEEYRERPRLVTRTRSGESFVRVLPFSAANLPRTCYLVIDRSSELITRPLREFGDLGYISNLETQERTLPVFDNHRIAKRFSTKRDRVVKIPDSRMLHKARYHLQAKGITRLLIDGQVYSLSPV